LAPSITPKKGIGMDTQENEEISQAEYDRQVAWVEDLAREIRRVDGAHKLGASELAQSLMPFLQRVRTGEAVPFAYVIPGDGNANDYGWIDCRVTREGEFTQPVYLAPPSPPSSRELMEKIKAVFKTHKDTAIAYGFTGDADMFSIIEDEVCALIPQEPKEEGNG
jgi:hypothetical protein